MGAEDRVVGPQVCADTDGDGLLSDIGVASTVDEAALVGLGLLLLAATDEEHAAIQAGQLVDVRQ
jgi:hypothetical protein